LGGVPSMALGFGVDSDGALSVESCRDNPWSNFLDLVQAGNLEKVRSFLSGQEYKLSVLAGEHNLPMRLAAEFGFPDILEFLLKNPYVRRDIGICNNVALKTAVNVGEWGCAAILCRYGADIGVLSAKNQTWVQEAFEGKYGCVCPSSWFNQAYNTVALIFDGPSQVEGYNGVELRHTVKSGRTSKKCKFNSSF